MLRRKFLQFFGLAPAIALTPKEWIEEQCKSYEVPKVATKFTELSPEENERVKKVFSQYVGLNVSGSYSSNASFIQPCSGMGLKQQENDKC